MTKKLSKSAAKKIAAARIQRAVSGYQIPMLEIVPLYRELEIAVAAGQSDNDLVEIVDAWPRVKAA